MVTQSESPIGLLIYLVGILIYYGALNLYFISRDLQAIGGVLQNPILIFLNFLSPTLF